MTMEHRDHHYYEAHAATINLEEITSSAQNAMILQGLRDADGDTSLSLCSGAGSGFFIAEGDDLGWLGYFIGSEYLVGLRIDYLPDEEGHAFVEGIARSQSIRYISIGHLISNDAFISIIRALHSVPQLEMFILEGQNNVDPDGWSELGILLESGVCKKLKELNLRGHYNTFGIEGLDVLSNGLRGIGSSLKTLVLSYNSIIGNDALLAVVEALQNCTGLGFLDLSGNDFSLAAAGMISLSDWLQNSPMNSMSLHLNGCRISDEGLQALAEGAVNNCEELELDRNESITSTGLSYLSSSIRSDSCRVEHLSLKRIPIGDDGLELLGQGLVGNHSLTNLILDDDISITSAGWLAFSRALCDTSSVNSTYLSNHTICFINNIIGFEVVGNIPLDISRYIRLNQQHPQYAARCKILMSHPHLGMEPLLQWGLKSLPLAVAWFERAKPCTTLTIHDEDEGRHEESDYWSLVLDESDEAFESRELTAMYEFVRGMPMEVMKSRSGLAVAAAYDKKIARIEEENKIALEQRDRKIEQLEQEIMELRGW